MEYTAAPPPLALVFDFNPETLSRARTVRVPERGVPGHRGYDFRFPTEAPRAAWGVQVEPESFSIDVLIDATDAMAEGDQVARTFGIEPQLDTLRAMLEPKTQGPGGVRILASLGRAGSRAFAAGESASVLLFLWGAHVLPVFLTSVRVEEQAHLPSLRPYRAEVGLDMQVIEGDNPFYVAERAREFAGAVFTSAGSLPVAAGGIASAVGGLLGGGGR